jgi:hypothetical protein
LGCITVYLYWLLTLTVELPYPWALTAVNTVRCIRCLRIQTLFLLDPPCLWSCGPLRSPRCVPSGPLGVSPDPPAVPSGLRSRRCRLPRVPSGPSVVPLGPPACPPVSGAPGVSWVLQQHSNSLVQPAAVAPSPSWCLGARRPPSDGSLV